MVAGIVAVEEPGTVTLGKAEAVVAVACRVEEMESNAAGSALWPVGL